jgi:uncharacterized protein (TIGR03086 family)
MDLLAALRDGLDDFDAAVGDIGEDQWDNPTPCAEWSVRDLLNHMTAEALWAPHLFAGERLETVGDRYEGDVLGDDPRGAWSAAARRERAALAEPDVLAGTTHTSMGELPTREYAVQRLTDLVVHRWDLARGTGQDAAIDETVAGFLYEQARRYGDLAATGVFGPAVEVDDDAGPVERLLALLGRQP